MMITADAGHLWCRIHCDHRRVMTSAFPLWPTRPVNHRQGARDPSRTVLAELQWPRSSHPHQPMKLTLRALMTAGRRRAMSRALVIVGKTTDSPVELPAKPKTNKCVE